MDHSEFFKLIKRGTLAPTYLLHGDEEYVKAQAVAMCERTVDEDLRLFNVTELKKPSVQELDEACETLPLFSERRFVIVSELPDAADVSKYVPVFEGHSPETVLLLVFRGKLPATSAAVKFAVKHNAEVLFEALSPNDCAKWCVKHMNEAGVLLPPEAARTLVGTVGTDMANLVSETDKLISFVGEGGTVTPSDISVCTRAALDVRIFDMLDMFTYGKPGDGIVALHALIDEGNEPMSISAFLVSRFKLMLEARRFIDARRTKREFADSKNGSRFANEKAYDSARRFTQSELLTLIGDLSDTGFMKISGTMKEEKYLELMLLKHNWRTQPI